MKYKYLKMSLGYKKPLVEALWCCGKQTDVYKAALFVTFHFSFIHDPDISVYVQSSDRRFGREFTGRPAQ